MSNKGQFGVTRTSGFYGQMIRLGTRSQVDHAFIVVDDHGGIVEATNGKVRTGHVVQYPDAIYSQFPFREPVADHIANRALSLIGTPYNYIDIGVLALMSFDLHAKWMANRAKDTSQLFCSQAVDYAYALAGVHLFKDKPTGFVTPGDLLMLIAQRSACTSIPEA